MNNQSPIIIMLFAILLSANAQAATINAVSCSQEDVQSAIDAAQDDDTVQIPAGQCTWGYGGTYVMVNKFITLQGSGQGNTVIEISNTSNSYTSAVIRISAAATVKGFSIRTADTGNSGTAFSASVDDFRITDIGYYAKTSTITGYFLYSSAYGLVDHCNVTGGAGSQELIFARGPLNSWQTKNSIGKKDNLFIEDSVFNGFGYVTDCNSNSRCVIRHNIINGVMKIDGHGKASNTPPRGVRHIEIYGNRWTNTTLYWTAMEMRGGSGVIFNNYADATGSGAWFYLTDYGYTSPAWTNFNSTCQCPFDYPVDDQIGVGMDPKAPASEPMYLWNNTKAGTSWPLEWKSTSACQATCGNFTIQDVIKEGRDYYNDIPMPGYTPYTYPHPLTLESQTSESTYWVSPSGTATWANCNSETPLDGTAACSLATANANASAGDVVNLRGGNYVIRSQYGVGLNPKKSGTAENKIIFKAYGSEKPTITASANSTYGIFLSNNDYIVIDGLSVKNTHVWMYIVSNSDNNEMVRCTFMDDTGEEGGFGINIWEMCPGGSTYTCPSTHNWIHNNTIMRKHYWPANQSCVEGADLIRIGIAGGGGGNDYNTIEDNYIAYAGHALFDGYGRYTVFKNNIMHNEPWITDFSNNNCYHKSVYINPAYNNKFSHRGMQITGSFHPETGTWDLVEGNRIGYAGVNPNNPGAINFEVAAPKNIIRLNYLYGSMRLGMGFKYAYSGDNRVYRNTFFHNGFGYDWMTYDRPNDDRGHIKGYTPDSRKNIIKENIAYDRPIGNASYGYWWGDITHCTTHAECNNNWLTANGNPKFTNPDLTDTSSRNLPDLSLQADSPMLNKGESLTLTTNSGSGSIILKVNDSQYFQDGTWGSDLARGVTLFPDWIAIGTVDNVAEIESIDYDTNTITLKSPISWNENDPVWLYKDSLGNRVLYGSAPDIGAYEFTGTQNNIPGDVNKDGIVSILDIQLIVLNFGKTSGYNPNADLNIDGTINLFDVMIIVRNWGAE